jgi:hypothetical protein
MQHAMMQPKRAYEKPTIEELGSFAALTAGSKLHSLADLTGGQPHHPGS